MGSQLHTSGAEQMLVVLPCILDPSQFAAGPRPPTAGCATVPLCHNRSGDSLVSSEAQHDK